MGAGAVKPGTPAVGGKGAAQPSRPTLAPPGQGSSVPPQGGKTAAPGTILNPNNPNNVPMPGGKGAGTPSNLPDYAKPYMPTGLPPAQVPPQGGKSQAQIDQINADMAAKRTGQPLVPAQGGKGGGQSATPEQLAALQAQLDASRLPPTTTTPSNLPGYAPSIGQDLAIPRNALNANIPMQDLIQGQNTPMAPSNVPSYAQPLVQKLAPVPAPIAGLGLAALRNKPMPILKGRR